MLIGILFFIFKITVIIQLLYYLFFFRFAFSGTKKTKHSEIPVSIIICAKNEAENIPFTLAKIANQIYQNFELILVNDHSTDETLALFHQFKKEHLNLDISIIDLQNNSNASKKKALTKGIEIAKNEYLLLTDADCFPDSIHWISEMTSHFNSQKTIVLGYGKYQKIPHSWLNKLIRFETLLTAIQYFSYAKMGLPYMGVGRNIAYSKSNFIKSNGFSKHLNIRSGDDDLFINSIATKVNTTCCISKDSFTTSKPHTNFKQWIHQKRRHITTASHYKPIHQFLLGFFYLSQFLFWLLTFTLLFSGFNIKLIGLLFLSRTVIQYITFGFSAKKLNELDLILFTPFLELFLILVQMCIFIQNLIRKSTEW